MDPVLAASARLQPVFTRPDRTMLSRVVNAVLARFDLAIIRPSKQPEEASPSFVPASLPDGADAHLRPDHPRIAELEERYRGHPAATVSLWSGDYIRDQIDLRYFRGDNPFVWQRRITSEPQYGLTTYYLQRHDRLGLLDLLSEDGLFGAYVYDVDGIVVSRDLLDSVLELTFLADHVGIGVGPASVLDIGAGYGRLAHRASAAFDDLTYVCTDSIAVSTFLAEYYLDFRGADRAQVVPLDEVETVVADRAFDVAVNIHSFSECPFKAIEWWLDLVASSDVRSLMIVPNRGTELVSKEADNSRRNFQPAIEARGFKLAVCAPKYARSAFVQRYGLAPAHYLLFERVS
jgi:SAM-dependent methyltransferase